MRQEKGSRAREGLGFLGLVAADQLLKIYFSQFGQVVWNEGGVAGIWPQGWWRWLSVVGLVLVGRYWLKSETMVRRWPLVLILAGGLSNLLDRWRFGAVPDYIFYPGVKVWGNLADIYLAVGVGWLIWQEVAERRRKWIQK